MPGAWVTTLCTALSTRVVGMAERGQAPGVIAAKLGIPRKAVLAILAGQLKSAGGPGLPQHVMLAVLPLLPRERPRRRR